MLAWLRDTLKPVNCYYAGYACEIAQHLRPRRREQAPETRFVLFGRGRSGTTLLLSLLDQHPRVSCDGEILNRRVWDPHRLLQRRCGQHRMPVYGFKLLSYQLQSLQTHLDDPKAFLEALVERGYRVLYLRRQNLLRHALSGLYAEHRRQWHSSRGDSQERPSIHISRDELFRWLDGSAQLRQFERRVLGDVPHLSLFYEDHLESASDHAETLDRVTDWLDLTGIQPEVSLQKTTPRRLSALAANAEEVRRWVANSPYARHLSSVICT